MRFAKIIMQYSVLVLNTKTLSFSSSFINNSVSVYFIISLWTARMILEFIPVSVRRVIICMMPALRLLYCRMGIRTECSGEYS
jgi:hypothetical protein